MVEDGFDTNFSPDSLNKEVFVGDKGKWYEVVAEIYKDERLGDLDEDSHLHTFLTDTLARFHSTRSDAGNRLISFGVRLNANGEDYYFPSESERDDDIRLGMDLVLDIKDIHTFASTFLDFIQAIKNNPDLSWFADTANAGRNSINDKLGTATYLMWAHATPEDFANPVRFMKRVTDFVSNDPFKHLEAPKITPVIKSLGASLDVVRSQSFSGFETPFELDIRLTPEGIDHDEDAGLLPTVRYGVSEASGKKVAFIYAIQQKKISGVNKIEVIDSIEYYEEQAEEQERVLKDVWENNNLEFRGIFGELPAEVLDLEGIEFLGAAFQVLQEDLLSRGASISWDLYRLKDEYNKKHGIEFQNEEELAQSLVGKDAIQKFLEIQETLTELEVYKKRLGSERLRKQIMRKLYRLNKEVSDFESEEFREYSKKRGRKELSDDDRYVENISDVSPSAVVSLTAALDTMRSQGIDEVHLPTQMLLRWQDHEIKSQTFQRDGSEVDRIHRNTTEKFLRTARRVCVQVDGVDLFSMADRGESFMILKLRQETWRSGNELMQELLSSIQGSETH